jgi:hypothetical protein
MGTVNATLLSAEPITTWVKATLSWSTSPRRNAKWSSHPGDLLPLMRVCGVPASRRVLFLTQPEEVGGNEVK